MLRDLIVASILVVLAGLGALAQGDVDGVRARLDKRFDVLPVASGIVLTPRFRTGVRSIEISDSIIAIDGSPATGIEVRERLGDDADLVLQVSYLDSAARRSLAGGAAPGSTPPAASVPTPAPRTNTVEEPTVPRARRREDVVRIGGSVTVEADESVRGDVVAVGGSATVNGEVDGDVVVVGGSATFGPRAYVRGDVTAVGGGVHRDPGTVIRGGVHEIGFGGIPWGGGRSNRGDWGWNAMDGIYPLARFMGTLLRVGLLILLAGLVILVARTPVEQIADRAAAEPVKAWAIGFLAEILFVPILVVTVVVLTISVIGIPVLALVPIAIVALMLVFLVGFTGVAYHLGRLLQARVDWLRERPLGATLGAIALIVSPLLVGRLLGLAGVSGVVVWALASVGFIAEYLAWTTGLGAAALVRFGDQAPREPPMLKT